MARALLKICDLNVRYFPESGDPVLAVNGLTLEVGAGQVLGILGESGSGKSTLAAAIMRMLPATSSCTGSILFDNEELTQLKETDLRRIRGSRISMIPQDPASSLNPVIRVATQVAEVLRAHTRCSRAQREHRTRELLSEVGFTDVDRIARSYPHQLSGGQRQRLAIAQAIACRPSLVIADEPTSKLDAPLQAEILALISDIVRRQNSSVLWITHDPATLAGFADDIAVMHNGEIVEFGPASDVFRRPQHPYSQSLISLSAQPLLPSSSETDCFHYAD